MTMNDEKRTCRICGETKSLEEFETDRRYDGDRTNRCKSCKVKSADRANHAFYKLKQRAEKAGSKVEVTLEEVKAIFDAFSGICIYCGAKEEPNGPTFHLEHVRTRSQGGRDHANNLVISCPTCNAKKHAKPVVGYFLDDERFKDENFNVLVHYMALSEGKPISEKLEQLVNEYAIYELRKMHEEMERDVK